MKIVLPFISNTLMNFIIGLLLARFLAPAEYGRMALALASAQVMQSVMFDWLRLSATRFYSERTRLERPELRASLDAAFTVGIVVLCVGGIAWLLAGIHVPLSNGLVGLSIGAAVISGLFDYHTALVRARFLHNAYARIIMGKNVLSLVLTVSGSWYFGSAAWALAGLCISVTGSLVAARHALTDTGASVRIARMPIVTRALRYAVPIVTATVLYQVIPLVDRAVIAHRYGFAESGQFSLAYDLGIRIAGAVGSTLDVLLFQIAVRAEESHGAEQAGRQVARNMAVVLAIIAPTITGVWLVLPSFEHLVVPPEFRGPFGQFLQLMLPGFAFYALIHCALHPVFQIRTYTAPLFLAGATAAIANLVLIQVLTPWFGALGFAWALTGSLGLGLALLIVMAALSRAVWPSPKDVVFTLAGTLAMGVALLPLRSMTPGVLALALQSAAGIAIYMSFVYLFDLAGLRNAMIEHLPWPTRPDRRQNV